jgi:hypothetical protein
MHALLQTLMLTDMGARGMSEVHNAQERVGRIKVKSSQVEYGNR